MSIARFADAAELAQAAAALVLREAARAVEVRGRFHLALAGGSTPRATYRALAGRAGEIDFAPWEIWFGDERCVPPEDPRSNNHMAAQSGLLACLPRERVHRMQGEHGDAAAEARRYEDELTRSLGETPRLDLVLLGLGQDGHTASLFPGDAALEATTWVAAGRAPVEPQQRVTLTLRTLQQARCLAFLVAGSDKHGALRMVFGPREQPPAQPPVQPPSQPLSPARRAAVGHERALWLLDNAAAEGLPENMRAELAP